MEEWCSAALLFSLFLCCGLKNATEKKGRKVERKKSLIHEHTIGAGCTYVYVATPGVPLYLDEQVNITCVLHALGYKL